MIKICKNKKKKNRTAISRILPSTIAEISSGSKYFCSDPTWTTIVGLDLRSITVNGKCFISDWTVGSLNSRPIRRLTSNMVFSGFDVNWFLAASPIKRSPSEVNAT